MLKQESLVCTSIDDRYLWPWMMMINSGHSNVGQKEVRYLLANINEMLSPQAEALALEFCKIIGANLEVAKLHTNLKSQYKHHYNLTIYSRIVLMDQLEEEFLWLDADLLLFPGWTGIFSEKGDLSSEDGVFHAVRDIEHTLAKLETTENAAFHKAGNRYFNAGVLRINPMNWRALPASRKWFDIASHLNSHNMSYSDQDILNYFGADKTSLLPGGYNLIVGNLIESNQPVFIRHFAGSPKPWNMTRQKKELLLAIQGANYFRQENSIMTFRDAFLDYPLYWSAENELLAMLKNAHFNFFSEIEQHRMNYLDTTDLASRVKIEAIKFLSRRFRHE